MRRPVESAQYTSLHFGETLMLTGLTPLDRRAPGERVRAVAGIVVAGPGGTAAPQTGGIGSISDLLREIDRARSRSSGDRPSR